MGIIGCFSQFVRKYPQIIFFNEEQHIDNLYFDFNGIIHQSVKKYIDELNSKDIYVEDEALEKKMYKKITEYTDKILDLIKPKSLVYIAIDGPAPRAKMNQQRQRRYKSSYEKRLIKEEKDKLKMKKSMIEWDTNAITPGTRFMYKLTHSLKRYINRKITSQRERASTNVKPNSDIEYILSSSNEVGEGEHKILDHIRGLKDNIKIAIYGLDADLIMLSMASRYSNILLLRENVAINRTVRLDDSEFKYLNIDLLKDCICQDISKKIEEEITEKQAFIDDYIFLCFLLGNDFLPHFPSIKIKEGGLDLIVNKYVKLYKRNKRHILKNNLTIDYGMFKYLINNIAYGEVYGLKILHDRYLKKKHPYNDSKDVKPLDLIQVIKDTQEDTLRLHEDGFKERYYSYYFDDDVNIRDICLNYIEGLSWVLKYYFRGCPNWSWYFKYNTGPLISDLSANIINTNINVKFTIDTPCNPLNQLMMVLPPQSNKILPIKYQELMNIDLKEMYPKTFKLDKINKTFLYECIPFLPLIDYTKIKEKTKDIVLTNEEKRRNKIK